MSYLVVDASVATKWFLPEENSEEALQVLNMGMHLLAPDLLHAEVGNVIWKTERQGLLNAEEAQEILADVVACDIELIPVSVVAQQALEIGRATQRTFYDSLYLAVAQHYSCPLVTADLRMFNALRQRAEWSGKLIWVSDLRKLGG